MGKTMNIKDISVDESKELINRCEIKDSPFVVVTVKEGSFGTLGKYRLTEVFKTKDEAIIAMEKITWNRIIQVMSLINNLLNENK